MTAPASMVVYIPSYNNSAAVCQSAASCPDGVPLVISDNHSEELHRRVLENLRDTSGGRCEVIFHDANAGRVENWAFCVRHFAERDGSGLEWMKWLFAGDTLHGDVVGHLERAVRDYPQARFIVAEHDMVEGSDRKRWRMLDGTQLVLPARAMHLAAATGNWFGPPLANFIHRDAAARGVAFGDLPWSADFQFCVNVAAAFPVLYLAQNVGVFQMQHRQYYSAHGSSVRRVLNEAIVRIDAARKGKALTGDAAGFAVLIQEIEDFAGRELLQTVLSQPDTRPIALDAARSLGVRRLLQLVLSEGMSRLRPRRH